MKRWLIPLVFLLAVIFPTSSAAAEQLEKISFKLSWRHGVQFLGYYIADDRGYYAEEGLNVSIDEISSIKENSAVPSLVADGTYDFGTGSNSLAMHQKKGFPLITLAAVYQYGPQALFARVESGISTLSDISGRTVAIKSESWRGLIEKLLAVENVSMKDVREVESGFDLTPFYDGSVDVWAGFITHEVALARLRGMNLVTFPLYEYGVIGFSNHIFTTRQILQERPEIVVRFLRATLKGWKWAVDNPEDAVDIFVKMFPDKAQERDFHRASFSASIPLIRPPGVKIGFFDCQKYATQFNKDIPRENFCRTDILEKAWESLY